MDTENVQLRRLVPDEWVTWRDVRLRSLADAPDAFGSTLARERDFTEEDWRLRLADPTVVLLVDGVPVAIGAGWRWSDGWLQVVAMWTDPAYRGGGLATLVLDELVAIAGRDGRAVVLDVTRGNSPAQGVYERYGFVATGESRPLREGSRLLVDRMVIPR